LAQSSPDLPSSAYFNIRSNHPAAYIHGMAAPNPDDSDRAELARLVRQTIDADRFPLSPRVQRWKALLSKLAPESPAAARPYMPPKAPTNRQRRRQG
jgi:hypothetical protein